MHRSVISGCARAVVITARAMPDTLCTQTSPWMQKLISAQKRLTDDPKRESENKVGADDDDDSGGMDTTRRTRCIFINSYTYKYDLFIYW